MRVAIVEDDPFAAADLEEQFTRRGWDVVGKAADSQKAKRLFGKTTPELVLMDVELADGPTGPALVKSNEVNGAFIVFLTGHSEAVAEAYGDSMPVLSKPYTEADIDAISIYARDALAG